MFFNSVNPTFENVVVDEDVFVVGTAEGAHQIYLEGVQELSSILGAMHVADVAVNETALYKSVDEAQTLMEASAKAVFARIIEFIVNIKNKIAAWFKKVIENIKIFFMGADKFIAQYESKIKGKSVKGFEHKGHIADMSAIGKIRSDAQERLEAAATDIMKNVKNIKDADAVESFNQFIDTVSDKYDREQEKFIDSIKKAYGRDTEADTITEFSKGLKVDGMINVVKGSKKIIGDINAAASNYDADLKKLISEMTAQEKEYEKDDKKSYLVPACRKVCSTYNKELNYKLSRISTVISCEKSMYRECLMVLKKFAMYRGEKVDKNSAVGFIDNFTL